MNRVKEQFITPEGQKLLTAGLIGDNLKLTSRGRRVLLALLVEDHKEELLDIATKIIVSKDNEQN